MQKLLFIIVSVLLVVGCVPSRQFQELKDKNSQTVAERDTLKSKNQELVVQNTELEAKLEELNKRFDKFAVEHSSVKDSAAFYKRQFLVHQKMYNDMSAIHNKNAQTRDAETVKLLAELQITKEGLLQQEVELKKLEKSLEKKQTELDERDIIMAALDSVLNSRRQELDTQMKKVAELEHILFLKDSAVNTLKTKITDALLGFEDKGLTIHQRNGKVYVTMDNKLLFKSGKWDVDPKGQEALAKISNVLEQNPDINILVEGHTDDVPMKGAGEIEDNWDLSVKRATAIVKIIKKQSKIDMKRITAAGRSHYLPVDNANTTEARAKNRRTEIILTPKLDELFQILESN